MRWTRLGMVVGCDSTSVLRRSHKYRLDYAESGDGLHYIAVAEQTA